VFNENPVPSDLALFNTPVARPDHAHVSAGTYFQLNDSIGMSLAYSQRFQEFRNTGSIFPLLGTSTTVDTEYDSIAFGPEHQVRLPAPARGRHGPRHFQPSGDSNGGISPRRQQGPAKVLSPREPLILKSMK